MAPKSVTYRDLRNTPGQVFERLATGEPLELVADGITKAVLIPVEGGDAAPVLDAWRRGRALLALGRLQVAARATASAEMTLTDVTSEIKAARKTRRARESAE